MEANRVPPPRLPYRVLESGDGPYMFFVHGMLSSRRQWTPNLAAIGQVCTNSGSRCDIRTIVRPRPRSMVQGLLLRADRVIG